MKESREKAQGKKEGVANKERKHKRKRKNSNTMQTEKKKLLADNSPASIVLAPQTLTLELSASRWSKNRSFMEVVFFWLVIRDDKAARSNNDADSLESSDGVICCGGNTWLS